MLEVLTTSFLPVCTISRSPNSSKASSLDSGSSGHCPPGGNDVSPVSVATCCVHLLLLTLQLFPTPHSHCFASATEDGSLGTKYEIVHGETKREKKSSRQKKKSHWCVSWIRCWEEGGARSKPVRPLLPLSSCSVQGRSSSCLLLLTRPAALSHPGGEVEGAQPLGQGRLQLLQGPIPPAVGQRGDVAPLPGPGGSQQQAPEVLSLQQRWHVLQEVTLAEGAELRRAVGLREGGREGGWFLKIHVWIQEKYSAVIMSWYFFLCQ